LWQNARLKLYGQRHKDRETIVAGDIKIL
jgi:hypothetical protein